MNGQLTTKHKKSTLFCQTHLINFDKTGRGDSGKGLQGEGVRAEEGELLPQRQLWLRHPGAH